MRISDWSSDVCSSDLLIDRGGKFGHSTQHAGIDGVASSLADLAKLHAGLWESPLITPEAAPWLPTSMAVPVDYDQVRIMDHWLGENRKEPNFCGKIGRASCRERVRQYVELTVVSVTFK